MEKVPLGKSGIRVTRLCLGSGNIARRENWGPDDEKVAVALFHYAFDTGCNFVDTARVYGSEEIIGKALQGRREKIIVASKLHQCEPLEVAPALEASLQKLQTDYLDLYICHWPKPSLPLEPFLEALARQRAVGKIRALGVSNFNLAQMQIAAHYGAVSLQPPFSILWRAPEAVLNFCRKNLIALTPYSPLAQGMLTGRFTRQQAEITGFRKHNLLFSEEIFPQAAAVASRLDHLADKLGCTSSQAALAWVLQTPGITSAIVGATSTAQWQENLGALQVPLSQEDYRQLDQAGLAVWKNFDPESSMSGWKPT